MSRKKFVGGIITIVFLFSDSQTPLFTSDSQTPVWESGLKSKIIFSFPSDSQTPFLSTFMKYSSLIRYISYHCSVKK